MPILTNKQIDQILQMQSVGHLGIIKNKAPHVVPIAYVYDGKYIFAHAKEGEKIHLMRKNRQVCFQVEAIDSIDRWRSVIVYGHYKELVNPKDIEYAATLLRDRFEPMLSNDIARRPEKENNPPATLHKTQQPIYFRIAIKDRVGRYEKQ